MGEMLRAGFAQNDILPQLGEEMAGYGFYLNRRGLSHLDPLRARAVTLATGENRLAVLQLDLIGLSKEFVSRVRERAEERFDLPAPYLMIHCTHTHSGPTTYPYIGCGRLCVDYLNVLEEKLMSLLDSALSGMRSVKSCYGFQEPCKPIAFLRAGEGKINSQVRGILFDVGGASPIAIVSYACHPVVLGRNEAFSADYPGRFLKELNAYGLRAVFLNEPCGDLDPLCNACQWGKGSEQTLDIYGRDLAEAAFRGLDRAEPFSFSNITASVRDCTLLGIVPDEAELEGRRKRAVEELNGDSSRAGARVELEWLHRLEEQQARGALSPEMSLEAQVLSLGEHLLVGLAGEVFSSLGEKIRDAFPDRFVMLAGTCNGLLGYVPNETDVAENGYASQVAPRIYGMLSPAPSAGEAFTDQVIETIQKCLVFP